MMKEIMTIEEMKKAGLLTQMYETLGSIEHNSLRFQYNCWKEKFFNVKGIGEIKLTYNRTEDKIFLVLHNYFKLPQKEDYVVIKHYLPQYPLWQLMLLRQNLRPIKGYTQDACPHALDEGYERLLNTKQITEK